MSNPKVFSRSDLSSALGELQCDLSRDDLRLTAYELFVAACRVTGGRPLTYVSQSERTTPSLQRSLTSSAAHQVKQALGLKLKSSSSISKKKMNVQELLKIRMGISEEEDTRIRRGLLRISAGQLGRSIESMILPLELLQHLKPSDFSNQNEYKAWQSRYLKVIESGMIIHPHLPLEKSDFSPRKICQIISKPLDSESLNELHSLAISLASRSFDGSRSKNLHWADGPPLNLHLYEILLDSCLDHDHDVVVDDDNDDDDEIMDMIKKTWSVLGMNQSFHDLISLFTLLRHFSFEESSNPNLVTLAEKKLTKISKNSEKVKDPVYSRVLTSVLTLTMNWADQQLFTYHDSFHLGTIGLMRNIISLSISSEKILAVDNRTEKVDAFIRSSLRKAFAALLEASPDLSVLAKSVGELAKKEKEVFSPVLLTWHPLAAAIAMSALHVCYGRELKKFIADVNELTCETVDVLNAADDLERELVQRVVESSEESEDGGKSIIREMPPFEAGSTLTSLARAWVQGRVDFLSQRGYSEDFAAVVDLLRSVEEIVDDFFGLPIRTHHLLLPDLFSRLDESILLSISSTKAMQGIPGDFYPELPPLTRCPVKSTLPRKSGKAQNIIGTQSGVDFSLLTKLCSVMNTLHRVRAELDRLEKKGGGRFNLSSAAARDALQLLCEIAAARIIFVDLHHVIYGGLYLRNGPTMIRTDPLVVELDLILERISNSLHSRVRNRVVTALMKTCFDGFLLVLLAGGPGRRFRTVDYKSIEEDFTAVRNLFLADGDGLPKEVVEKAGRKVRDVVALFGVETETLILKFRERMEAESGGERKKMRVPVTTGRWGLDEASTLLRVLCHRDDEVASRFLKKTFGLPKKL